MTEHGQDQDRDPAAVARRIIDAGAALRLYRAVATQQFVILGNDDRVPVEP